MLVPPVLGLGSRVQLTPAEKTHLTSVTVTILGTRCRHLGRGRDPWSAVGGGGRGSPWIVEQPCPLRPCLCCPVKATAGCGRTAEMPALH